MDFQRKELPEIQEFRREVSDWLDKVVSADFPVHADPRDVTYEDFLETRELGKKLGANGWLWPTVSPTYGGGGLSIEHSIVIDDELDKRDLSNPPYYDPGSRYGGPVLMVWGSEEQKSKWLPDMFSGKLVGWQLFTYTTPKLHKLPPARILNAAIPPFDPGPLAAYTYCPVESTAAPLNCAEAQRLKI